MTLTVIGPDLSKYGFNAPDGTPIKPHGKTNTHIQSECILIFI